MWQQVKDLAWSLQQFRLLLWGQFDPWRRNFHMQWSRPKKKKKNKVEIIRDSHEVVRNNTQRSYVLFPQFSQ